MSQAAPPRQAHNLDTACRLQNRGATCAAHCVPASVTLASRPTWGPTGNTTTAKHPQHAVQVTEATDRLPAPSLLTSQCSMQVTTPCAPTGRRALLRCMMGLPPSSTLTYWQANKHMVCKLLAGSCTVTKPTQAPVTGRQHCPRLWHECSHPPADTIHTDSAITPPRPRQPTTASSPSILQCNTAAHGDGMLGYKGLGRALATAAAALCCCCHNGSNKAAQPRTPHIPCVIGQIFTQQTPHPQ